ncbi:right-handed parallel beta-helix repeat-containing protein [Paenibacillus cymbidii]|uniref:right-handed parallel beta-helix repeat-containing protein n=1 Tax=Paenibacillus cymbidii TaxID=1639034 RepID=UPI001081F05B|nr:right-handed parallel beta-helix repeat-containing protein [Paenibacillus cymbidii]
MLDKPLKEQLLDRRQALVGLAGIAAATGAALAGAQTVRADDPETCCWQSVTVADLRAATTPVVNMVYYVIDRGKEGIFLYDEADTTSADNLGTILVSTASGARFKRIYDEYIDVRWFGAVGDGISRSLFDLNYANLTEVKAVYSFVTNYYAYLIDGIAIQAAIECVRDGANARSREIFIPKGRYCVNTNIKPTVDNLVLRGTMESVLIPKPLAEGSGSTYTLHTILTPAAAPTTKNLVIRDLRFELLEGYGPDSGGPISLNYVENSLIENCHVRMDTSRLTITNRNVNGIVYSSSKSSIIRNCTVDGSSKPAIYVAAFSENIRVEGCIVRNVRGPLGQQAGFVLTGSKNLVAANCQAYGCQGTGFLFQVQDFPAEDPPNLNLLFTGCQSRDNEWNGFDFSSQGVPYQTGAWNRHVKMVGCTANNNYGEGLQMTIGVSNVLISAFTAYENGNTGIYMNGTTNVTMNAYALQHILIANSSIYNNNQRVTSNGGIAIRGVKHLTIQGGTIHSDFAAPVLQQSASIQSLAVTGYPQDNIIVQDVHIYGNARTAENSFYIGAAVAASGYYSLQLPGTPTLSAPYGSVFTNTTTGKTYVKTTATNNTGWREVAVI